MRNALCITRRDLGAYFTSPIGYIFIMVFVTISVGLYMTQFFLFPVADMRPYFDNLPLLLCVFIPAVTMRIWAEERKENTWEMLLTFPMQAWELVIGKFLAAVIFFALTLFATITVPAMLISLGNLDVSATFAGYFGTFLLGTFFLSLGILFSGFFKDQIVAFVVTLLSCFAFFLLGTEFIAAYIDGRFPGLGSLLSEVMGLFTHFTPFTKGIVDAADVLFFIAWTVLFLALNVLFIDGRNRPRARTIFFGAAGISVAIGLMFNYLMADMSLIRFDLTENKIYTISEATKTILSKLDAPVKINVYVTPKEEMPAGMKDIERTVTDKLQELSVATSGKVEFKPIYLNAPALYKEMADDKLPAEKKKEKASEEESVEKRMLDKGVEPFSVQAFDKDSVTNKLVYSSIGVAYKNKTEEILTPIMPQAIDQLEYRLVSTIYKMTREKKPVVALVAPEDMLDPQLRQMLMQQGMQVPRSEDAYENLQKMLDQEKYDVRRVQLTKESPLPDDYDTLVVVNPKNFNDRQRWEVARALHAGKSVVLAIQTYEWDYKATPKGVSITRKEEKPEMNDLLDKFGLGISDEILMDTSSVPMRISSGNPLQDALSGGGQPFNLPMQIRIANASMAQDVSVTNRISDVFYLWGTALKIDDAKAKAANLDVKVLAHSTDSSWTVAGASSLTKTTFEPPSSGRKAYPLMAMVTGQFPDAYSGKERPVWPKAKPQPGEPPQPDTDEKEPEAKPVEAKPGKLIVMGCAEMFRKNFLQGGNADLFMNSVDAVTLDDNLVKVRGQKPIDRTISEPTEGKKTFWRLANYGFANIIIAGIGIGLTVMRRQSRNAYTMAHTRD